MVVEGIKQIIAKFYLLEEKLLQEKLFPFVFSKASLCFFTIKIIKRFLLQGSRL